MHSRPSPALLTGPVLCGSLRRCFSRLPPRRLTMAQSKDLGQKFTCFECECKFYDLGAPEPICPRCGADQREAPEGANRAPAAKKRTRKAAT